MIEDDGIDEAALGRLVRLFYARVREDAALGPIFNGAVDDWPEHLETLTAFWSSVMLGSGRYKGQPMVTHMKHRALITPALFERWLTLWSEAAYEALPAADAGRIQERARRIAQSLQLGLFFQPGSQVRRG